MKPKSLSSLNHNMVPRPRSDATGCSEPLMGRSFAVFRLRVALGRRRVLLLQLERALLLDLQLTRSLRHGLLSLGTRTHTQFPSLDVISFTPGTCHLESTSDTKAEGAARH